jgi:hypothetical protein
MVICRLDPIFPYAKPGRSEWRPHVPTHALNALDVFLKMLFENDVTHQIPRAAIAFSAEE